MIKDDVSVEYRTWTSNFEGTLFDLVGINDQAK